MKLSKVILEEKKVVHRHELMLTNKDVDKLTTRIADRLDEFIDSGNRGLLELFIKAAIKELIVE